MHVRVLTEDEGAERLLAEGFDVVEGSVEEGASDHRLTLGDRAPPRSGLPRHGDRARRPLRDERNQALPYPPWTRCSRRCRPSRPRTPTSPRSSISPSAMALHDRAGPPPLRAQGVGQRRRGGRADAPHRRQPPRARARHPGRGDARRRAAHVAVRDRRASGRSSTAPRSGSRPPGTPTASRMSTAPSACGGRTAGRMAAASASI